MSPKVGGAGGEAGVCTGDWVAGFEKGVPILLGVEVALHLVTDFDWVRVEGGECEVVILDAAAYVLFG